MFLTVAISILLVFITILIYRALKIQNYWKERGVKYVKPLPFVGNILPFITNSKSLSEAVYNWYNQFPSERYFGIFQFSQPILIIRDPELIKSVTIKDFENFGDHGLVSKGVDEFWDRNVFASHGERWRNLRHTLSPIFTSSKLRGMFALIQECAKQFNNHLNSIDVENEEFEMKDFLTKFTNDVIVSTALGIQCNSFKKPNNDFLINGRNLSDFTGLKKLKFFLSGLSPLFVKLIGAKVVDDDLADFYKNIINQTVTLREKQNLIRPDLIHLLMLSRKNKLKFEEYLEQSQNDLYTFKEISTGEKVYLSNEDIASNAVIFFMGGLDTTANSLSFIVYELAVNPDVQKKLRQEISIVYEKCDGKVTYEQISEMKYLEMVISETQRKWPQGTLINRSCTKSFEIEPEKSTEKKLKLNVGDVCWIPVYGIHMDPKYYPNPEKFDPERFNEENIKNLNNAIFLPFGSGPRNCIGSRFALLATKILLFHLLSEFELVPTKNTQIPLRIKKNSGTLLSENLFPMGLKKSPICNLEL